AELQDRKLEAFDELSHEREIKCIDRVAGKFSPGVAASWGEPRMATYSDADFARIAKAMAKGPDQVAKYANRFEAAAAWYRLKTSPQRLSAVIYFSVASMALWMWLLHPSVSFFAIVCCAASSSVVAAFFASPSSMA